MREADRERRLQQLVTFSPMSDTTQVQVAGERFRRLPSLVDRLVSFAVIPGDRPDLVRIKRLFTAALWVSLATSSATAYQLNASGARWAAVALCLPLSASVTTLALMGVRPATYPSVMHLVAGASMITIVAMVVILGGVFESAGNTLGGLLVVVGAAAIFADRRAHWWLAAFLASLAAGFVISQFVEPLYVLPNREYFALFNIVVVGVFVYFILYYFVRQTGHLYRQSEDLLRTILPEDVVERLKTSQGMVADEYESASILFADVVGFTPLSSQMEPEGVVNLLNEVFTTFDNLVEEHGLEKIKTIGDAYMVAAGVPVPRDDHALAICDLALELQDHLKAHDVAGRRLEMRIGIASGPVMAGIIGRRRFSYDLWGDTVNLASRMESTGTPGRIQMTESTRQLVQHAFLCEQRGVVDVKGRGPMETWYLVGRAAVP
jgi:adenylate cyclase